MALTDYKISSADLVNKGVVGLPDTPALNATQMQEKFDEIATDVIIPKYNGLVDAIISIDPAGKMEAENPTGTGTFAMNPVEEAHLGDCSTTLGDSCEASGEKSLAGGYHSTTEHDVAFVYGDHVESTSDNCAVFGSYNAAVEGDLFEIGDGSYGSPSNAFGVHSNGDVYAKGSFTDGSGNVLSDKANSSEVYKKTETYNKSEVDTALSSKANVSDLANKMDINNPVGTGTLSLNRTANTTVGQYSVAVGLSCEASGDYSFAEGRLNRASGQDSHAEGATSIASGAESHAEGGGGEASGQCSHVEGVSCKASKIASHAEGFYTKSSSDYQHVEGKYNVEDSSNVYAHIIGNGTSGSNRSNAFAVKWDGDVEAAGEITDGNGITLSELLPTDTASGNPCVITDAFGRKAKSLSLDIEPIQSGSGTPSPDNVRPISGISSATVTRTGKNVLPNTYTTLAHGGITYTVNTDGSITFSGLANTASVFQIISASDLTALIKKYGGLKVNNSGYKAGDTASLYVYKNNTWVSVGGNDVTLEDTATYGSSGLWIQVGNGTNITTPITWKPMLRVTSETDTEFEPYTAQTITDNLNGTWCEGTVDFINNTATFTRKWVEFDGSDDEGWEMYGTGSASAYAMTPASITDITAVIDSAAVYAIANYLQGVNWNTSWGTIANLCGVNLNRQLVCGINTITTLAGWKTYLASNHLQVCYLLNNPVTVSLSSQNIDLLHGDNVLTSNAKTVNVSYKADIQAYIEKKIAEGGNRSLGLNMSKTIEEPKEEVTEEPVEQNER